jgi:hypothetical protein
MQFGCAGCNVKPFDGSADDGEGAPQAHTIRRLIEPSRRTARMRQRDEDAIAIRSALSHDLTQRQSSPETFDRERSDEQNRARSHERELRLKPRRAQSDFGWRWSTIPCSSRGFARKALCDRRAIRKMRFIDAGLREPAPKLSARASRERQTRGELDRARSLANDHHAIARLARDDRECGRQVARIDAPRARADAGVQTFERVLWAADHGATVRVRRTRLMLRTGCSAAWQRNSLGDCRSRVQIPAPRHDTTSRSGRGRDQVLLRRVESKEVTCEVVKLLAILA